MLFIWLCIYIYIYFLYGSVLIRAVGTTAHPGTVATVPHGCPAVIRATGTTVRRESSLPSRTGVRPRSGRRAPRAFFRRDDHCTARRIGMEQAVNTPAERCRHRRRWLPSRAVEVKAQARGCRISPAYGTRQRRPVHGVFGRHGRCSSSRLS
jgi:hypothetical protein